LSGSSVKKVLLRCDHHFRLIDGGNVIVADPHAEVLPLKLGGNLEIMLFNFFPPSSLTVG
jgi:hypothetical protein